MIFTTTVAGIPCKCEVLYYQPARPMKVYGSGMGDCEPPEPEEFEFRLLDRKGYPAPWLENKLTSSMEDELLKAFNSHCETLKNEE